MKLIVSCCIVLTLLKPLILQANNLPIKNTPQYHNYVVGDIYQDQRRPRAFFLDTALWPYNATTKSYNIPVCWENLTQSSATERKLVTDSLTSTWVKFSLVKFTGWGACPSNIPPFPGIRITVVDNALSPRAALGTAGKGKAGVMLLNFRMNTLVSTSTDGIFDPKRTLFARCQEDNNATLQTCIQSTAIHEFGHILGLAHEQNRTDDPIIPPRGLCTIDDLNPYTPPDGVGTFTTFGNTMFTDYDSNSMMNYCRSKYYGRIDLSPLDKLALRVYYGQMSGFDIRTRILKIPRILKYDGTFYTGSFNLLPNGTFQQSGSLTLTTTPSKSPATLNASGVLHLPELKYTGPSGHVNQILKATLSPTSTPGIYTRSWVRIQPTQFTPTP